MYRRLFGGPQSFIPLDDVGGGRDYDDSEIGWWQSILMSFGEADVGSIYEYLQRYMEIIFSQVGNYMCISMSGADEVQNAKGSQVFSCDVLTSSKCLNIKIRQLLQDVTLEHLETNAFLINLGLPFCIMSMPVSRKAAIIRLHRHGFHLPKLYLARGTTCVNSEDTFERYSLDDHSGRTSLQSLCVAYGF